MINKDSNLSLDKICRSCMTEANQMRSVYDTNTESVQLAEMIMACASVQVISGDGLPTLICPKCEEQLSVAYIFKQQCERTDATLREYTNHHTLSDPIKEESESLDIVVKPDIDVLEIYDDNNDDDDDDDDDEDDDDGRDNDGDDDDDPYSGSESQHSNYSTTVRRKKKPAKNRQCRFCNKMLSTKEGLRLHERRHTGEKLKSCPVCHATFAKSNHLIRHMQMHNKPTDEYKHTCQECGMGFTKASHLLKHKKEHKQTSSSSSVGVGNKDDSKVVAAAAAGGGNGDEEMALVKREVDSDEEDGCPTGDDLMSMSSTSNRPKLRPKKEPNDPDKLHPCKICRKSFTKTSHLNRHMLTHGVTPPKGGGGGGGVKDKSNEPKEKKYMACEFCDRKFVYRKSFLHHIQLEHQISEDSDTPLSEYATIITKSTSGNSKLDASTTNTGGIGSELSQNGTGDIKIDGQLPDEFEEFMRQEEAKKVHVCHVCNHRFTRANHLTRHMTLHRAVLVHKCDRCEKAFMTPEHLATHVQEYHVDRPYVCSLCNKPFSRGEHLIRHLKVHDKDMAAAAGGGGGDKDDQQQQQQQQHKCSICEKVFARSDHLARHTKLHLAQDKRHVCGECGKAFNRLDNLRTHARIHTGVRDPQRLHLCIYCGKEFNNSSNMIVHMRRHTGERPYKCAQCGKGFPRSHDLKCHERTHSGEKPYLCTLCGKSFNKSNKLLRHTRVHTGERPYVCSLCGRAFTQSNDLALHMRRHTGSRPYACGMCPARFIQSGQLKAHRRTQGHWLETQPELKGAHRVTPVTPLVNPPPIKFKTRVQRIKEEPSILGHTIGITSAGGVAVVGVVKPDEQQQQQHQQQQQQSVIGTGNVRGAAGTETAVVVVGGGGGGGGASDVSAITSSSSSSPFVTAAFLQQQQSGGNKDDVVHNFSVTNLSRETTALDQHQHRPTTSTAAFQQPGTVEPSGSFTITSNTFTVSEGYTYQSYG